MIEKEKIDFDNFKNRGFIQQKQEYTFSARIHVIGGQINTDHLRTIADVADNYGQNFVHITSRQGVEIPYISIDNLDNVENMLYNSGINGGAAGKKFRSINACLGTDICKSAIMNTQNIAKKIDKLYFGCQVPKKFKVAISGCPASCMKVQYNDFGIMGVLKPKILPEYCIGCGLCIKKCPVNALKMNNLIAVIDYHKCVLCGKCIEACNKEAIKPETAGYTVFVGGKVGRIPQAGIKLEEFIDENRVLELLKFTLEYYRKYAFEGERLGILLNRLGIDHFIKEILGE